MPHFLIEKNSIENNKIRIKDREILCHLVQSLRIKENEIVKFISDEIVHFTKITSISKNELTGEIINSIKSTRKLNFDLCCLISILKQDAMHLAIENAVQVGTKEIYTTYSDNSAVKKESIMKKSEKWQKIALESFKQCERADIPKVFDTLSFEEVFKKFKKENILIFAENFANRTIQEGVKNIDKKEKILAVFGPEGGFSKEEFEYFKKENFKLITLGNLIYKAPNAITAGLFGIVQYV